MSNKNEKKSNVWLWILAVLVLIALVVVLILHPWNRSEGDAADTPAVTATAAPAETGTVESNSSLGEADQAAAEAATGEQQSTTIEDKSGLIESIRVQDTLDTEGGKEVVYSIHLNGNASLTDIRHAIYMSTRPITAWLFCGWSLIRSISRSLMLREMPAIR